MRGRLASSVGSASRLNSLLVWERAMMADMSSSSIMARQSSSGRDERVGAVSLLVVVDILDRPTGRKIEW